MPVDPLSIQGLDKLPTELKAQNLVAHTFSDKELQNVLNTAQGIEREADGFWKVRVDCGHLNLRSGQSTRPCIVATLANTLFPCSPQSITVQWIGINMLGLEVPESEYEFGLPYTKGLKLMDEQ